MKKLFVLVFVLTMVSWSYAQKSVDFVIKNSTGKLFEKVNDAFLLSGLKISGLQTASDYDAFKKLVLSQTGVKEFDYLAEAESNGMRKAKLVLASKEEPTFLNFMKAVNVKNIIMNDKSFTLDQSEQLKNYLKQLKEKHKERANASKNVSGQNSK